MADDDITLGEVYRMVERIADDVSGLRKEMKERSHVLSNRIQESLLLAGTHGVRINAVEKQTEALEAKVDGIAMKSAAISGGIGVVAYLVQWFHK